MLARGVRDPLALAGAPQGDLRAEDARQAECARGLGETDHAVETIVVRECEARETKSRRFDDQLFGVARAV